MGGFKPNAKTYAVPTVFKMSGVKENGPFVKLLPEPDERPGYGFLPYFTVEVKII